MSISHEQDAQEPAGDLFFDAHATDQLEHIPHEDADGQTDKSGKSGKRTTLPCEICDVSYNTTMMINAGSPIRSDTSNE